MRDAAGGLCRLEPVERPVEGAGQPAQSHFIHAIGLNRFESGADGPTLEPFPSDDRVRGSNAFQSDEADSGG